MQSYWNEIKVFSYEKSSIPAKLVWKTTWLQWCHMRTLQDLYLFSTYKIIVFMRISPLTIHTHTQKHNISTNMLANRQQGIRLPENNVKINDD